MKRIENFSDFINLDFISESRVYFLRDLVIKLRELYTDDGNEWALKLLNSQGKNIDSDTTFLNLDGENFSFSKENDLRNVLPKFIGQEDIEDFFSQNDRTTNVNNYLGSYEQDYIQKLPNRSKVKMGRIIKKLLPEIPDKELESLVNSLRSEQTGYEIKLVKGQDIAKYYRTESCDSKLLRYGTLQSSCMMDKADDKPYIFDVYTKNPETCQLAVMLSKDGKLVARALVWKVDEIGRWDSDSSSRYDDFYANFGDDWQREKVEPFDNDLLKVKTKELYFMDRVYYTKDWINSTFQKWAKENNFMTRQGDAITYKAEVGHPIMFVKLNKLAYRQFPYMDTFKNYDVQSATLSNYEIKNRGFKLSSTTGDYHAKGSTYQTGIDKATNFVRRFKDFLN